MATNTGADNRLDRRSSNSEKKVKKKFEIEISFSFNSLELINTGRLYRNLSKM